MLDFFLRKMSILIEINGRVASQIILVYSDISRCGLSEKQKKTPNNEKWLAIVFLSIIQIHRHFGNLIISED